MDVSVSEKEGYSVVDADGFFDLKKAFFDGGHTLSYAFRREKLERLRREISNREQDIADALYTDLKKSHAESFLSEIGVVYAEIDYALKNLKEWMMPESKSTPLALQVSKSEVHHQPKGVVLIIAPWNYPINLVFAPLVGAIAAGNCVVIKPSEEAPASAQIIEEIVQDAFQKEYISVVQGLGHEVVPKLLKNHVFNHVFFTGSPSVGKIVARLAAENLTSTTLELGGKSPAVVDESAHLKTAAKRLVWGKFLNAGQTCVAPDYVLIEEKIFKPFTELLIKNIKDFYGVDAQKSKDYPRLIHEKRFDALTAYLRDGKIIYGGKTDRKDLYIEPTLITEVSTDSKIIQEEIFGPILPLIPYSGNQEMLAIIAKNPYPLSCYYFGNNKLTRETIIKQIPFGGGCINNTLVHLANPELPFGGIQTSGSGNYHGKNSFLCFSHAKSMVVSKNWFDPFVKYPPFNKLKLRALKKLL